jgi:sugar lactone lactonase YvrE
VSVSRGAHGRSLGFGAAVVGATRNRSAALGFGGTAVSASQARAAKRAFPGQRSRGRSGHTQPSPRANPRAPASRRSRLPAVRTLCLAVLMIVAPCAAAGAPASAPAPKRAALEPAPTDTALAKQARDAYAAGDKAAFLAAYEELARRRPGEVFTLYNLACGQALSGRAEAALATLARILALRSAHDLDAESDFDSLRSNEEYKRIAAGMSALRNERVSSGAARAFTIPEKGFIAEGVAFDARTRSFFVASIRRRKIVRIDRAGKIADFVGPARDGLRSALGLAVDSRRRILWAASQAFPSMDGYTKDQPRLAAVFEYDLDSGRLRKEHRPPPGDAAAFDDLTLAADGTVFVNDGSGRRIWRISPGKSLEVFIESGLLGGTQGMAVSSDGKRLYVSDYRRLYAVEISSKRVTPIAVPSDLALSGIDGLAVFERSLIGVQNGIVPHRVIRLDMAPGGVSVQRGRILEMNHPDFDEPTLGTVVDGAFYFSADSQGQRFLDAKHPIAPEEMREAVILKLALR